MTLVAVAGRAGSHTSFDEPGENGGYGLADRFAALKATLKSDDHHLPLHCSSLRAAILPDRTRHRRRSSREQATRPRP